MFTAISCSELMYFEESHECFKDYNSLFIPIEVIFLFAMFPYLRSNSEMLLVNCQCRWRKKIWKIFCFISLLIIQTRPDRLQRVVEG